LALKDPEQQKHFCSLIIQKNLSVREAEKMISRAKVKPKKPRMSDPNLLALQEDLLKLLGTKVSIQGNQNRGTVKIYYYSLEDLNRIYELIKGVAS
jgi:ParB family chromosome partitioning protein